jgi:lysophospholipase L1-like esterase
LRFFSLPGATIVLVTLAACGGSSPGTGPTGNPPSVSCPADVVVHGAAGPAQPVSYPTPAAQGGKPPVAVSCSPATNSMFAIGTTPVTCTATDGASRTGTCSFNVTLTGLQLGVTRFVAFGDSVTLGENGRVAFGFELVDTPNAYPTKLEALLNAAYPNQGVAVSNRGVGGEPIESGKARLPGVLAGDNPGALLIIDGYNNLLADCHLGDVRTGCSGQIEAVAGGLREMVRIARGAPYGLKFVFVSTLTPPGVWGGPAFHDRRIADDAIQRVNTKIRQQIPGEGGIVVDVYPRFLGHESEYISPDGLHLDPPGNDALASVFFDAIRTAVPQNPLLQAVTAFRR